MWSKSICESMMDGGDTAAGVKHTTVNSRLVGKLTLIIITRNECKQLFSFQTKIALAFSHSFLIWRIILFV